MYVSIVRNRFIIAHTFFTVLLGIGGAAFFQAFHPHLYFRAYPVIPVFFYLFGLGYIALFEFVYKHAPDKLVAMYLLVKFMKLLFGIILVVAYGLMSSRGLIPFVSVFVAYYIIYLVFETHFFFYLEVKLHKKKKEALQDEK